MEKKKNQSRLFTVMLITAVLLTACGAPADSETASGSAVTEASVASGEAASASASPAASGTASASSVPIIPKISDEDKYIHSEDGYYNLDDDGIPVHLRVQHGGTCWLFAAALAMETGYEIKHHSEVKIDPMDLLYKIYQKVGSEGYYLDGTNNEVEFGGMAYFVVNALSNGFDEWVLDQAVVLLKYDPDVLKEMIKKYGAAYIAVPDADPTKKKTTKGYMTMNDPKKKPEDFDHSIAIVGWDDHFPRDYFAKKAKHDGAWITANSHSNGDYYYVSYDTVPDFYGDTPTFMSMTDEYSHVAAYDCGVMDDQSIKLGKETVTANVFHEEGTLAAVGTYSLKKNQEIEIKIYDSKLKKCLHTQKAKFEDVGYFTVPLTEPIEVKDYAIAIRYTAKAPVEGAGWDDDGLYYNPKSKKGQSFILVDGKWMDLYDKNTREKIGIKKKINNCCIKGLYKD